MNLVLTNSIFVPAFIPPTIDQIVMSAPATHIAAIVQLFEIFLQTQSVSLSLKLEAHQFLLEILKSSKDKQPYPLIQDVKLSSNCLMHL